MTAVCYHCGDRPASCYGAYEGSELAAGACDICCGHGNEDGWCIQIADMLERETLVQEVIAAHAACSALASPWSPSERAQRQRQEAGLRLKDALDKLSEFKP